MNFNVIGLMSGTSLDGVDAALVSIDEAREDIQLIAFTSVPYSDELRKKLLEICDPKTSQTKDVSLMNIYLGERFADAAFRVCEEANLSIEDIQLISSHGQTVFHQPEPETIDGKPMTSTLQIGDIGVIAERTGVTTVGDFRTRDMAAGGQGAPLVPFADYYFFRKKEYGRILVNIGGISNITVLGPECKEEDIIAYDTGPGNMVIDFFAKWATNGELNFDRDGLLASKGNVDQSWLESLLNHPYFKKLPPKSTGREEFGKEYASKLWKEAEIKGISIEDRLATITHLTAFTLAEEMNRYVNHQNIAEVIISGGGTKNNYLLEAIKSYLPKEVKTSTVDEHGWDSDAKEAMVFALLGYLCFKKKPNNLPAATGANHPVVMGKIAW